MKKYTLLLTAFVFVLCGTLPVATALAAVPAKDVGTVISMRPGAFVLRGGVQTPLAMKDRVQARDSLITDASGRIQVLFDDDSTIALAASTRLDLKTVVTEGKPEFRAHVGSGLARFITGKIVEQNPDGFNVTTPRGTVGIRGTIFAVRVSPSADTIYATSSRHGAVVVGQATGGSGSIVPTGSKAVLQGTAAPEVFTMEAGDVTTIEKEVALGIGSGTEAVAEATPAQQNEEEKSILAAGLAENNAAPPPVNPTVEDRVPLQPEVDKPLPGPYWAGHTANITVNLAVPNITSTDGVTASIGYFTLSLLISNIDLQTGIGTAIIAGNLSGGALINHSLAIKGNTEVSVPVGLNVGSTGDIALNATLSSGGLALNLPAPVSLDMLTVTYLDSGSWTGEDVPSHTTTLNNLSATAGLTRNGMNLAVINPGGNFGITTALDNTEVSALTSLAAQTEIGGWSLGDGRDHRNAMGYIFGPNPLNGGSGTITPP